MTASPTPLFAESANKSDHSPDTRNMVSTCAKNAQVQPASAVVPSEEEIARAIYHGKPRNRPWDILPHEFKNQYRKQARAVLTLFAPVLAENNRMREDIIGLDADVAFANIRSRSMQARALSAEAERDALKTKQEMAAEAGESCRRARIADDGIDIRIEIDRGFSVCWRDRGCFSSRHTTDAEALPGLVADIIAEVRRARSASADIRGEG